MLTDGLQLLGASTAENFTIDSGASLPSTNNNLGELYYLTTGSTGLYVYNGTAWEKAGAEVLTSAAVATALGYTPAALSNGKILSSQLPAIAITDTFVVSSQAAMLALSTAETGDVAVRTDLNKTFILKGTSASTLADWQELLSPTDVVTSVNGQTGTVSLSTANIAEVTNLYFTNARARVAISLTAGSSGATYNSSTGVLDLSTLSAGGSTAASALTGTTLASNVVTSSLTSVGTLSNLVVVSGGSATAVQASKGAFVDPAVGTAFGLKFSGGAAGDSLIVTGAVTANSFSGSGSALSALNASNLGSGTVPTARLGSGTANSTTYLRGDNTWASVPAGVAGSDTQIQYNNGGVIGASANLTWNNTTSVLTVGPQVGASGGVVTIGPPDGSAVGTGTSLLLKATSTTNNFSSSAGNITLQAGDLGDTGSNGGKNAGSIFLNAGDSAVSTFGPGGGGNVVISSGTGTTGNTESYIVLKTAPPDGALIERLRILNNGAWSVGTGGAATGTAGQVLISAGASAAPSWSSSGASLTNLNASNLSSGTVAIARLGSSGTPSATTYLRGDGSWATPAGGGSGTVTSVGVSSANGAITVGSSPVTTSGTISLTANTFTTTVQGVVPGSGGGTANFLRADGTWTAPTATATSLQASTASGVTVAATGTYIGTAAGRTSINIIHQPALTDQKAWNITVPSGTSGTLQFNMLPDALSSEVPWMSVARSGTTATLITLTSTGLNLATGTGGLQLNGAVGTTGQVLTSQGAGAAPIWGSGGAAAAGSLTGTTLAANVVSASLATITGAAASNMSFLSGGGTTTGAVTVSSGNATAGASGAITLTTGSATTTSGALTLGTGAGATSGQINFNLNGGRAATLWNDGRFQVGNGGTNAAYNAYFRVPAAGTLSGGFYNMLSVSHSDNLQKNMAYQIGGANSTTTGDNTHYFTFGSNQSEPALSAYNPVEFKAYTLVSSGGSWANKSMLRLDPGVQTAVNPVYLAVMVNKTANSNNAAFQVAGGSELVGTTVIASSQPAVNTAPSGALLEVRGGGLDINNGGITQLQVRSTAAQISRILLQNSTTGYAAANGLLIQQQANGLDSYLLNYSAGFLGLATGSVERLRIAADGTINTSAAVVQIGGGVTATAATFPNNGSARLVAVSGSNAVGSGTGAIIAYSNNLNVRTEIGYNGLNVANAATPGGSPLTFYTEGSENLRLTASTSANAGAWGIGGANYGTAGQHLMSNGSAAAPTWSSTAILTSATITTATINTLSATTQGAAIGSILSLNSGGSTGGFNTGAINITTPAPAASTAGASGAITIQSSNTANDGVNSGGTGSITLRTGAGGGAAGGNSGNITLITGTAAANTPGFVSLGTNNVEAVRIDSNGNLLIQRVGTGVRIKEGTNARMGVATLVAGTVTIANTSVTATTRIFLTTQSVGGTVGFTYVSARTAGTSFVITSSSAADTSVVAWMLVEPA